MIEVKNLVKKYGNHVAVDGLTFSIDKGRVYGFLGPNGAGKTTTMNIITGYLAATKGSVTVNGYDILKNPEEFKKSVGYLPELPPVYMDMTVREYLLFTAELKGVPKKNAKSRLVAQDTPENLERLFSGRDTLRLEAKGTLDQIKQILADVRGIEDSEFSRKAEDHYEVKLTPKEGADIRESLFFAFAERRCPLLSLYEDNGSLEDVYLKLIQEGGKRHESRLQKELSSFFRSMTGYVLIAFLVTFTGVYFMIYNLSQGYPYFSYTLSSIMLVLLVLVPVLTMRSFAEERKSKTDQLLFTSPVKISSIVIGKYLAMVTVYLLPNLLFCLFPLIIKMQGNAYLQSDYASIFQFFLMGCVFIAVGMFFSSLTESPIIAAVSTFAATLVLYIWEYLVNYLPSGAVSNFIALF